MRETRPVNIEAKAGVCDVGYPEDSGPSADRVCAEGHRRGLLDLPLRIVLLLGRARLSQVVLPE
jgi:hypothetical protein